MTERYIREERKVITALSADLTGSTALGPRLDPEDAREVVGGALARVIEAIEELGGTIKDLAGDGVLALFGAPVSRPELGRSLRRMERQCSGHVSLSLC